MKNLFPSSGKILLTLAVAFIALMAFSTYKLVHTGSALAFAGLVISCTGVLAVLTVSALDDAVGVLKPLLQARTGSPIAWTPLSSPPLTHRQNLEQGIANEVVRVALTPGFSSRTAGEKARSALDALTGAAEPVPAKPAMPAAPIDPIEAKGATFVSPADIQAEIVREHYFTAAQGASHPEAQAVPYNFGDIWSSSNLGHVTICVLVLRNGTKLVGVNYGAIDPARHDAEQGRVEARAAAVEQVWPLLGYELRTKLAAT